MIVSNVDEKRKVDAFVGCITGKMVELHIDNEEMSALLGINVRTWERKMKDPYRFKLEEIIRVSKKLKFDEHDVSKCFCFMRTN